MSKFKKGERVEWFGKSGEVHGNVTFCFEKTQNVATVMYDNGNYDHISIAIVNRNSLKEIINLTWKYNEKN